MTLGWMVAVVGTLELASLLLVLVAMQFRGNGRARLSLHPSAPLTRARPTTRTPGLAGPRRRIAV